MDPLDNAEFDGCRRECRIKGKHTRKWGECEFGIEPEPIISIWKTYTDFDGMKSVGTDDYNLQELAELIEPALRDFTLNFGSNSQALIMRGRTEPVCGKALAVDGTRYPPCARPLGHREAYCRDLSGDYYFITDPKKLNLVNGKG